jgi:putative ribosome biogenesis GTPase RsgA
VIGFWWKYPINPIVDYVFITTSVNEDLSYRRIERYLAVVSESEVRHGLRKQNKILAAEDRKIWKKNSINARNKRRTMKGAISE